jgi:serine palmitoyltransferase
LKSFNLLASRGHPLSPVKHLYTPIESDPITEKKLLQKIADECIENGLALITSEYLEDIEKRCPRPSIRMTVNRLLTDDDIERAFKILENAARKVLG